MRVTCSNIDLHRPFFTPFHDFRPSDRASGVCSQGYLSLSPSLLNKKRIFRSIGEGWNDKAWRIKKGKGGKKRMDGCICIGGVEGWKHRFDSIRFRVPTGHSHHPQFPLNGNRIGGFEICVAVLHDSGPGPRASDVEMAHAAPIVRIGDVKSLEPRQFRADFTLPDPGLIIVHPCVRISRVCLPSARVCLISKFSPILPTDSSCKSCQFLQHFQSF